MRQTSELATVLLGGVFCLTACASNPPPAPPAALVPSTEASQAPPSVVASAEASAATSPPPPAAPAAKQMLTLRGDEAIPEPWLTRFRTWLTAQGSSNYVAVTDTLVIADAPDAPDAP